MDFPNTPPPNRPPPAAGWADLSALPLWVLPNKDGVAGFDESAAAGWAPKEKSPPEGAAGVVVAGAALAVLGLLAAVPPPNRPPDGAAVPGGFEPKRPPVGAADVPLSAGLLPKSPVPVPAAGAPSAGLAPDPNNPPPPNPEGAPVFELLVLLEPNDPPPPGAGAEPAPNKPPPVVAGGGPAGVVVWPKPPNAGFEAGVVEPAGWVLPKLNRLFDGAACAVEAAVLVSAEGTAVPPNENPLDAPGAVPAVAAPPPNRPPPVPAPAPPPPKRRVDPVAG